MDSFCNKCNSSPCVCGIPKPDDRIRLEIIDKEIHHFVLTFNRPGRVEVSVIRGLPLAEVYEGAEVDQEQEPLFCYDGNLIANKNCEG